MNRVLMAMLITFLMSACSKPGLKNGTWRGTLITESGAEIPFNFDLTDSAGRQVLYILNGSEKFRVDSIEKTVDSLYLFIPVFDCQIRAKLTDEGLEGRYIKRLADKDVTIPFRAEHDVKWRFEETSEQPVSDISGRWSTTITGPDGKSTSLIGEFLQNGTKLTGTFLSSTGDYRFLEGQVAGDKLQLSSFNGTDAYLFTGTINNDLSISGGQFYSGYSSVKSWAAHKEENATLPDAYGLTALKPGFDTIKFSFPNLEGEVVSHSDKKFSGKVTIVQFLGSWCANCMDETAFLAPFYEKYRNAGVEVVGLAYERTNDFKRSQKTLQALKKRFDVKYDILITGSTNETPEVLQSMPMLASFMAFPTTIIIDKKGKVRKIHTGFSGPGTGKHYTDFIFEFESLIKELLSES